MIPAGELRHLTVVVSDRQQGGAGPPSGTPRLSGMLGAPSAHPFGPAADVRANPGRRTHTQGGARAYGDL